MTKTWGDIVRASENRHEKVHKTGLGDRLRKDRINVSDMSGRSKIAN